MVGEIKQEVTNLEARIPGHPLPSTAWCLLLKLFTLKLTIKQLVDMLDHETNPYELSLLYEREPITHVAVDA